MVSAFGSSSIQSSKPLADFLIMTWNTTQLFFCKGKENKKHTLHNFTLRLESKLKISSQLHFVLGKPQETEY